MAIDREELKAALLDSDLLKELLQEHLTVVVITDGDCVEVGIRFGGQVISEDYAHVKISSMND